jgi:hypothetical protein
MQQIKYTAFCSTLVTFQQSTRMQHIQELGTRKLVVAFIFTGFGEHCANHHWLCFVIFHLFLNP